MPGGSPAGSPNPARRTVGPATVRLPGRIAGDALAGSGFFSVGSFP
ncbi:hypothetical protein [Zafaria cholistanensis]|nr:hypothetical protein [Zafaria cholistanensis]